MSEIVICHPIRGGVQKTTFVCENGVLRVVGLVNDHGPLGGQTVFTTPEVWATEQAWAEARAQVAASTQGPVATTGPEDAPFQLKVSTPLPKKKRAKR